MNEEELADLKDILGSRPPEARHLLALLQAIQQRFRYLPETALKAVAQALAIPLSRVFSVASFYGALSLEPKGQNEIKVCCGTACHLRGAPALISALEEALALKLGQTSKDGRYSLESVNCLGACALAPVITVEDTVHGRLTPQKAASLFS
jgi:NADH-quinone oxidoreductase subunit E